MAQGDKRWVRFEPTIGWGGIVATLALILSVFSIYVNWTASSPSIRVMELRTNWGPIEDPNTQSIRYIALHPVAVSNTGGGTASLIGITGESAIPLVTGQSGEKPGSLREVPHEVFLSEYLADEIRANPKLLRTRTVLGVDRLSVLNRSIPPGEMDVFTIGVLYEPYDGTARRADHLLITMNLDFSDGTRYPLRAAYVIRPWQSRR